ncbi:sigma-70 family RNA polymerase sigma factor [soil metagenome]
MNGPEKQDSLLAVRCQLGDAQAWEELIRRWQPRLWRFVLGMLTNRASAEDVLQNVWLRVVRSLARLREPERLGAWLYGIARAAVADRLREQYRHPPADEIEDIPDSDGGVDAVDLIDSLQAGLARLHPADREVVVLFYLEERSINEVAEISNIPPGTVKSRLHRARRVIRDSLEKEGTGHETE